MQKKLNFFTKLGFLLTALAGTFLHFLYGLTGKTLWTGLFSSINESVWEHMKLVFFPLTAYFILSVCAWARKYLPWFLPAHGESCPEPSLSPLFFTLIQASWAVILRLWILASSFWVSSWDFIHREPSYAGTPAPGQIIFFCPGAWWS